MLLLCHVTRHVTLTADATNGNRVVLHYLSRARSAIEGNCNEFLVFMTMECCLNMFTIYFPLMVFMQMTPNKGISLQQCMAQVLKVMVDSCYRRHKNCPQPNRAAFNLQCVKQYVNQEQMTSARVSTNPLGAVTASTHPV